MSAAGPGITRRAVIGTGAVAASLAYAGGAAAYARPEGLRPIDAMLIDDGVAMPSPLAAFVAARARTLPVVDIRLDAAGHAALNRVLADSHVIVGISSGATLFCVERIAWDHGYRLTARTQRCHADFGDDDACRQDVVAFLNGAHPFTAQTAALAAYRPSLDDGTLHAWAMRKDARTSTAARTRPDHTESFL